MLGHDAISEPPISALAVVVGQADDPLGDLPRIVMTDVANATATVT